MESIEQILRYARDALKGESHDVDTATAIKKITAALNIGVEEVGVQLKRDELKIEIGEREMTKLLCAVGSVEQAIEFAALCQVLASQDDDDNDASYWHNVVMGLRRVQSRVTG